MMLRDGVEFEFGMTLTFASSGRTIETNEQDFEIEQFEYKGSRHSYLCRKGSHAGTDLKSFYSSREIWVKSKVDQLVILKKEIDQTIEEIANGADPNDLPIFARLNE